MLIGEVFGTPGHQVVQSISSSKKFIFIDFKIQDIFVSFGSVFGTVATVANIKYNKINYDCQSWLNNNMLMSPNNPNINCSWIITRKFGSYITLDFKFFEVKSIDVAVIINYNYIPL